MTANNIIKKKIIQTTTITPIQSSFRVGVDGQASAEVMDEFDPLAEEVIFMPIAAISGG